MPNPDTVAAIPGRTGPPWTAEGRCTSSAAGRRTSRRPPACGCPVRLPPPPRERPRAGAHGRALVQACKATSRRQFDLILACGTAAAAKHAGRETGLRPDWEQVKFEVMLCGLRGKFALEPYRSGLLLTHPDLLAEDSPTDFVGGARDRDGGYGGQNLLGLAVMRVRDSWSPESHPPERARARPLSHRRATGAH